MQAREKVEKSRVTVFLHAVVARSTFQSQKVENTSVSDHLWKLTCRKSARRSGANHILKSKGTKHLMFEVRNTFRSWDVEKVHAGVARSTFQFQNVQNTSVSDHFWKLTRRKSACRCGAKVTTWKTEQFCETSPILELDNVRNTAILRDFLNFQSWQHQKRSNSARRPWKMESWVQIWRPRTNVFLQIFPLHLCKVLRLPRKSEVRSYEVLHLSCKISLANLKIWCSKMQPLSGA